MGSKHRSRSSPAVALIGTSGWSYDEWRDRFYAGVPHSRWLEHYARSFNAVEINATFYGSIKPGILEGWAARTPREFRFALKASRFLTHIERLDVTAKSLARLREQADALGGKLAAVLWQLPKDLRCDPALLERFARRLDRWQKTRHAVEFRDESWFTDEVARCLAAHGIAAVQSHAADWPMWNAVTTDLVYVRLHGGVRTYRSPYSRAALKRWSERILQWRAEGRAVQLYFDNTASGNAVHNATLLVELCVEHSGQ
ncbi:MAG: DUF72 domain-containing protein [Betaproteobacteria bacterium]|nr:DUF72 domain-containing protein [Betaproteobacteria bacterium]